MISDEIDLVSFENIKLFSKKVTHKISKQNFKQFIKTAISLENIEYSLEDKIHVSYIEEVQTYEIYILSSTHKYPISIAQIFKEYYSKLNINNQIDLFITDKFFVIYKNKKQYFAKVNNTYIDEDIVNYIEHNYKIKINNIISLSQDELSKLQNKFLHNIVKKDIPKYIYLNNNNSHVYFIVYILLICFGIYYFMKIYQSTISDKNKISYIKKLDELKIEYKNIQNNNKYKNNITQELIELFNYLKIYKISVVKFKYKKQVFAIIVSKHKKNIYDFISAYDKNVQIQSIKYEDKIKKFIMDIQIEL